MFLYHSVAELSTMLEASLDGSMKEYATPEERKQIIAGFETRR